MPLALSFLSEKARVMVTGTNASSDTAVITPTELRGIAPSTAIKGSVITQASEAATETSPMAKTNLMLT
ncbi:MAG: hypothetical protein AUI16_11225 [Alphaproteobacteria bacterium 13_2_20CM_2_64_7]|jgi:hypothetical protein|nr:MAG: hypothetical protein AUI16_11225 [Alphaproteobacteria bacterium 13_2_20CM_2_64_7]